MPGGGSGVLGREDSDVELFPINLHQLIKLLVIEGLITIYYYTDGVLPEMSDSRDCGSLGTAEVVQITT